MIYALLIACAYPMPGMPPRCYRFEDQRGPYEERAACTARLQEMHIVLRAAVPHLVVAGMWCGTLDEIRERDPRAFPQIQEDTAL